MQQYLTKHSAAFTRDICLIYPMNLCYQSGVKRLYDMGKKLHTLCGIYLHNHVSLTWKNMFLTWNPMKLLICNESFMQKSNIDAAELYK